VQPASRNEPGGLYRGKAVLSAGADGCKFSVVLCLFKGTSVDSLKIHRRYLKRHESAGAVFNRFADTMIMIVIEIEAVRYLAVLRAEELVPPVSISVLCAGSFTAGNAQNGKRQSEG
jgi:hypothetical protein